MFDKSQIKFMRSLGLELNFTNLSNDDLAEIEEIVSKSLQIHGFDKNYEPTDFGLMCENILDAIP